MDGNKKFNEGLEIQERARIEAENKRNKDVIKNLLKENEQLRKQVYEEKGRTEQELISEKQRNEQMEIIKKELKKERAISRYITQLQMDKKMAEEVATAEVDGDMGAWQTVIKKHIEDVKAKAKDMAVQKLLSDRFDVHAGNGPLDDN